MPDLAIVESLEQYKFEAGSARVAFSAEQFEQLGQKIDLAQEVVKIVGRFATTGAAFIHATNDISRLLPNIFPAKSRRPVGHFDEQRQLPDEFDMSHTATIEKAIEDAKRFGANGGVIKMFRLSEFIEKASDIDCSVDLPYRRHAEGIWLDAVNPDTGRAVIGGNTSSRTSGQITPIKNFAIIINTNLHEQKAPVYYGPDYDEAEEMHEAAVDSIKTTPKNHQI